MRIDITNLTIKPKCTAEEGASDIDRIVAPHPEKLQQKIKDFYYDYMSFLDNIYEDIVNPTT